jgi:hypothetical protein
VSKTKGSLSTYLPGITPQQQTGHTSSKNLIIFSTLHGTTRGEEGLQTNRREVSERIKNNMWNHSGEGIHITLERKEWR